MRLHGHERRVVNCQSPNRQGNAHLSVLVQKLGLLIGSSPAGHRHLPVWSEESPKSTACRVALRPTLYPSFYVFNCYFTGISRNVWSQRQRRLPSELGKTPRRNAAARSTALTSRFVEALAKAAAVASRAMGPCRSTFTTRKAFFTKVNVGTC